MSDTKKSHGKVQFAAVDTLVSAKATPAACCTESSKRKEAALDTHPVLQRREELVRELGPGWEETLVAPPAAPGLRNLGSTCYVNALLQCLFSIHELRRFVVELDFEPKHRHERNVAYQLQLLFARLCAHDGCREGATSLDTSSLVESFGMGQSGHREQHDVQELARVLLDALQQFAHRMSPAAAAVLPSIFQGTMLDELTCSGCGSTRRRSSVYSDVSLPLCSFMGEQFDRDANIVRETLEQCLDSLTATDTIDEVECDACGQRTKTSKRQVFDASAAPRVLSMQLVRMHYDMETNRRVKLMKHIRLPLELNLSTWCAVGPAAPLESTDPRSASKEEEKEGTSDASLPYELFAVIAHRGTAYHGHYYAFIRTAAATAVDGKQQHWLKFDDETVSVASPAEVQQYLDPAAIDAEQAAADREQPPSSAAEESNASIQPPEQNRADGQAESTGTSSSSNTAVMSAAPNGSSPRTGVDDELDDFFADILAEPLRGASASEGAQTNKRKTTAATSGQSYYVFYRRRGTDFSSCPEQRAMAPPVHVAEQVRIELEALHAKQAELRHLSSIVPMTLVIGDTAAALASSMLEEPAAATRGNGATAGSALRRVFLEGREDWTTEELLHAAQVTMTTEEQDAYLLPGRGLRAFNPSSGVMGRDLLAPGPAPCSTTLGALGYKARAQTAYTIAFDEANDGNESAARPIRVEWDVPLKIHLQAMDNPESFVFIGVRAVPHGATANMLSAVLQRRLACEGRIARGSMLSLTWGSTGEELIASVEDDDNGQAAAVTSRNAGDVLYVELASLLPADVLSDPTTSRTFRTQASRFIYRRHLMSVCCTLLPADVTNEGLETEKTIVQVDKRLSLRSVKEACCAAFGLSPATSQLLIDQNSRELRNMDLSLSAAAIGSPADKPYGLRLLPYPPLPADHFFADVFQVAIPINYAAPISFVKRVQVGPETLIAEVAAAALGPLCPAMASLRARLLPPGHKQSLGVPMLHSQVSANVTPAHRQSGGGDVRIAFETLRLPAGGPASLEPLEKGALILHVHRWLSEVGDCRLALGEGHEIVIHKEIPAALLMDAVRDVLQLPAAAAIDVAPAKYYALLSHDSCYTKVPWKILKDESVLAKPIAAHPLKLEMDDIILVRPSDEEWSFVSDRARSEGHLPHGAKTMSLGKKSALKVSSGESAGGVEKKKARGEKAMTIHAVWDLPEEQNIGPVAEEEEGSADKAPPQVTNVSENSSVVESKPPAAAPDVLPSDEFNPTIHGTLDDTCKVCYSEFESGESVTVLMCHHIFHYDCLAAWMNTNPVCPLCMTCPS